MISAARVLGLAATLAVLLGLDATAAPANAQSCKDDRVTAKSEGRIRGETFATNEAKQRWEQRALERYGKAFGKWANAKDSNVECESVKSKRLGLPATVCTATGRPCAGDNAAVVEEREGDGKRDKSGRRDDRDDDRDRGRRGDRDGLSYWHKRAYDAAMRHEDYLAKRRRQVQKWAEQREARYWRHLYRRQSYGWE
jgi:hypothetical protein